MTALFSTLLYGALVASQSTSTVVCIPGQCIQGYSNTSIGVAVSSPSVPSSMLLLPGVYSATTNPELLHDVLTSSSSSYSPSPGFENSTVSHSLPLNIALEPGLSIFQSALYSGSSAFTALSNSTSNTSVQLSAKSIVLSSNVWAAVSSSTQRIVLWDSVPDISQLPSNAQSPLTLLEMQSSSCSPACSSGGTCSPTTNSCACSPGFTGTSCETCSPNFFGPSCQACPSNCAQCDDGITGTGRCLKPLPAAGDPSTCNCLNGECGSNGQCTCNAGWTTADNGTACAKCQGGFFENSVGDCKICAIGCTSCSGPSGTCLTCKAGFTLSQNDPTQCIPSPTTDSTGAVCPNGSFSSGGTCTPCDPSCATCNGPTSNGCTLCASGSFSFNGGCVKADTQGICTGTGLIADNNKHECDTCGAKCTACEIPNFSLASTGANLQCTACLPGSFLSKGQCISSCPSGTFVDPKDNFTCTACDPSCDTCSGSSTFCLTCSSNQQAFNGKCVSTCPTGSFSSNSTGGVCSSCHPDCATCSGPSFSQCLICPPSRPVLSNGRCLPTCSKNQFFDPTSATCQACDSSCASCSGAGVGQCLSCSSPSQVLKGGQCVAASCTDNTTVLSGLGVCLSDLVSVPSSTTGGAPLPSITGISDPTVVPNSTGRPLEWWEILLMALGCAFIFLVVVMCWRRRMRKKRQDKTKKFANAKQLNGRKWNWRWKLLRFGEKLFGHRPSRRAPYPDEEVRGEPIKMGDLERGTMKRSSYNTEKFLGAYADHHSVRSAKSGAPSSLPSLKGSRTRAAVEERLREKDRLAAPSRMSGPSLYSQITGNPRRTPDTKEPVKKDQQEFLIPLHHDHSDSSSRDSRLSDGTLASSYYFRTEAEAYKESVRPMLSHSNTYWLEPVKTGGSGNSNNPFNHLL